MKLHPLVFSLVAVCLACSGDDYKVESRPNPSVDTGDVSEINKDGATLHGEFLTLGSEAITDYGFIYSQYPSQERKTSDYISLGKLPRSLKFSARAETNLPNFKTCYYNTYAITDQGTIVYGVEKSFTSQGGVEPVITGIFPTVGHTLDTVYIIGSGFSDYPNANYVSFSSGRASMIKSSSDTLVVKVPFVHPGDLDVTLQLNSGSSITAATKFTIPTATFTSFSPTSVTFGDTVVINGSNFPSVRQSLLVIVLGQAATLFNSTPTQLKGVVADNVNATGMSVEVDVGALELTSTEVINLKPPVISDFTPATGAVDTEVEISGENFSPVLLNNHVLIHGETATVVSVSKDTIHVRIPALDPGDYPISIQVAGQKVTSTGTFKVL